jgi:hypothetical protein
LPDDIRPQNSLTEIIKEGARQGLLSFFSLFKVMVPVYIFISVLKKIQVLDYLAHYFTPFMKYLGLPGDTALAMVLGYTINIYAAIAAFAGLGLTIRQVTILGIILGSSHTLFMETAVVGQMKARPITILVMRISVGLLLGLLMNLILPATL